MSTRTQWAKSTMVRRAGASQILGTVGRGIVPAAAGIVYGGTQGGARPGLSLNGGARAGTRAPDRLGWRTMVEDEGRHKACPYRIVWGKMATTGVEADEGRHKACPYRTVWGKMATTMVAAGWEAQGLPLPPFGGDGDQGLMTRAGTRPAPTGPFGGRWRRQWLRRAWAGTRPAPTGPFGGRRRRQWLRRAWAIDRLGEDGDDNGCGGRGQAQGLPLPDRLGEDGDDNGCGGRGQAQGLPLPDRLGGILLARHVAGEDSARSLARGGRCGGAAPAQGRAEGPTAQIKFRRKQPRKLPEVGSAGWTWLGLYLRHTKVRPHFGMHPGALSP